MHTIRSIQTLETPAVDIISKPKARKQPPYAVILHNDDKITFAFVIYVIQNVFSYDVEKASRLALEAHESGRSILWVGSFEQAEFKAEQVKSYGPDPTRMNGNTISVSIEPLPGD